jgi:ferrous iron transport protein A
MNLSEIGSGRWIRVIRFMGGSGLAIKLRSLGIMPGDIARVVRMAPFGGPILIEIEGREIALGRGIAKKIEVEESSPP